MQNAPELKFPMPFYEPCEMGRMIRRFRKFRGLTQHELAMRTGTSTKFISNVETGKETAEIGKVFLLVRMLDIGMQFIDLHRDFPQWKD